MAKMSDKNKCVKGWHHEEKDNQAGVNAILPQGEMSEVRPISQ